MPTLVERALAGLRGDDPSAFAEALALASSFFEADRGWTDGLVAPEVADERASPGDLLALRGELVRIVRDDPRGPRAAEAVYALGRRDDPTLRGVLVGFLREHRRGGDAGGTYQALIALENLGEAIPWESDLHGFDSEAENRRVAERYLDRADRAGAARGEDRPPVTPKGQRDLGDARLTRHALGRFVERFGVEPGEAEPALRAALGRTRRLGRNPTNGAVAVLAVFRGRPLVAVLRGDSCLTVLTWPQFEPRLAEFGRAHVPRKWGRFLRRLSDPP